MAPEPSKIRRDLVYLRKAAGFTEDRLAGTMHLSQYDWNRIARLTRSWLSAHREDADVRALTCAFDPDRRQPDSKLTHRRTQHARELQVSVDAIAAAEDRALRKLADWLAGRLDQDPSDADLTDRYPLPGGYEIDATSRLMRFEGRRPIEAHTFYRIRAMRPGIINMRVGVQYIGDTRGDAMHLTVSKGRIVSRDSTELGAIISLVEFTHPLDEGESYEFTLDRQISSTAEPPPFYSFSAHTRTALLRMAVEFNRVMPSLVWTFRQIPFNAVPSSPTEYNRIELHDTTARTDFENLSNGLTSGIGWRW